MSHHYVSSFRARFSNRTRDSLERKKKLNEKLNCETRNMMSCWVFRHRNEILLQLASIKRVSVKYQTSQ